MRPQSADLSEIPLFKQLSVKVLLGLVGFLVLLIAATYFAIFGAAKSTLVEQAESLQREIGHKIVLKFGERVASAETLALAMAELGAVLPLEEKLFLETLPQLLESSKRDSGGSESLVAGGGIWPEPGAFRPDVERRSFFWSRGSQGELEYYEDYNAPYGKGYHGEEWYVPARYLSPGEVYWSKSYMDPYSLVPMVTCTAPYWREGRFAGVATVDLRLDGISEFMAEEAGQVEGYAFAVDRNDRLISFPDSNLGRELRFDATGRNVVEYRRLEDIAKTNPFFQELVERMRAHRLAKLEKRGHAVLAESKVLASKIESESYQIEADEALLIAESIMAPRGSEVEGVPFRLSDDYLLGQESLVSVFNVPSTDWSVLVAMPSSFSDLAVLAVADNVAKIVLIAVFITCILLYLYLWRTVLKPTRKLQKAVRHLAIEGQASGTLDLEGDDELGRIAYWFNVRTRELDAALRRLRESNRGLEIARAEAEAASQSKNIFLASMSHEIRTPMNAIVGLASILSEMKLGKEQASFVETINASATSLLSLINDILDLTKIEANELSLETLPFDLRELLDEVSGMMAVQAEEKGLEFSCYLEPQSAGKLLGDPHRLRQILINLASNAIKFTSDGRVDIYAEQLESGCYRFSVKDTGIGIPEDSFEALFESFRQVDSDARKNVGGAGLGLAICKRLSEKMGGAIDVSSQLGQGSEFVVTVQLEEDPEAKELNLFDSDQSLGWQAFVLDSDWPHSEMLVAELKRLQVPTKYFISQESLAIELEGSSTPTVVFVGKIHGVSHESLVEDLLGRAFANAVSVVSFFSSVKSPRFSAKVRNAVAGSLKKPFSRRRLASCLCALPFVDCQKNEELAAFGFAQADVRQSFGGKRVLLVEDHPVNQRVAARMLAGLRIDCLIARDGREALEIVKAQEQLDAILMDWQMPVMDGLDASREIRSLPDWRARIPIIAMTANVMQGDRDRCLTAGMNDYLSKPVLPEDLKEVLGRVLASR